MGIRVGVAGASGYAGAELLRLLAGHPEFEIATAMAHSQAGQPIGNVHRHLAGLGLTLVPTAPEALAEVDLVFLAMPHGESAALAAVLPKGAHTKIVDLGADHRLRDERAWQRYYGGAYAGAWTYGLPELPGHRGLIAGSTRVAATGCYAVAITLALAPLISAGLARKDDVVVVAESGTTGAGRGLKPHLLASEVMGGLSPYKVGAHQHVPEIKQATGARTLSFTPVLAPLPRGILATVTALPAEPGMSDADVRAVLAKAYEDEPFVTVLPAGSWPRTASTVATNACHLQAAVDADSGRIIVSSAIDNLGKGAAGQALQCANIMFGLAETAGLTAVGVLS
jgi:N-acetyl-gamma-glutamyl-phosphate reductase